MPAALRGRGLVPGPETSHSVASSTSTEEEKASLVPVVGAPICRDPRRPLGIFSGRTLADCWGGGKVLRGGAEAGLAPQAEVTEMSGPGSAPGLWELDLPGGVGRKAPTKWVWLWPGSCPQTEPRLHSFGNIQTHIKRATARTSGDWGERAAGSF